MEANSFEIFHLDQESQINPQISLEEFHSRNTFNQVDDSHLSFDLNRESNKESNNISIEKPIFLDEKEKQTKSSISFVQNRKTKKNYATLENNGLQIKKAYSSNININFIYKPLFSEENNNIIKKSVPKDTFENSLKNFNTFAPNENSFKNNIYSKENKKAIKKQIFSNGNDKSDKKFVSYEENDNMIKEPLDSDAKDNQNERIFPYPENTKSIDETLPKDGSEISTQKPFEDAKNIQITSKPVSFVKNGKIVKESFSLHKDQYNNHEPSSFLEDENQNRINYPSLGNVNQIETISNLINENSIEKPNSSLEKPNEKIVSPFKNDNYNKQKNDIIINPENIDDGQIKKIVYRKPVEIQNNNKYHIQNNDIHITVNEKIVNIDKTNKSVKNKKCFCKLDDLTIRSKFMIKVYGILLNLSLSFVKK